jgi:hypothetical protein
VGRKPPIEKVAQETGKEREYSDESPSIANEPVDPENGLRANPKLPIRRMAVFNKD